jgi:protein-tyrosine phosphatase
MDDSNNKDARALDSSREYASKIRKITDFFEMMKVNEVPDLYYSGDVGFELVIDILEDACAGLMVRLKAQ